MLKKYFYTILLLSSASLHSMNQELENLKAELEKAERFHITFTRKEYDDGIAIGFSTVQHPINRTIFVIAQAIENDICEGSPVIAYRKISKRGIKSVNDISRSPLKYIVEENLDKIAKHCLTEK